MALGSFKQEETAQMFAQLFARIVKLERQLGVARRVEEMEAADPNDNSADPQGFPDFQYYTIKVNTPDAANGCFTGQIMVPTDSTSKVTASNTFTAAVTVDVPANLTMPAEGDIVMAFFLGPYAVGKSRYMLGGAAGGSKRTLLNSVYGDYLTVTDFATSSNSTLVGSPYNVARPYKLQQTPWDGKAIFVNSVTLVYSYVSAQQRCTLIQSGLASEGFKEIQIVNPSYNPGVDQITVGVISNGSAVVVNSLTLSAQDLNDAGRYWGRLRLETS